MKRKLFFSTLAIYLLALVSCSDEQSDVNQSSTLPTSQNVINESGKADGVSYSFKGLTLNPKVIILNSDNSKLLSSAEDLSQGIIKISGDFSFTPDNVLYITSEKYTSLKKIVAVKNTGTDSYELTTVPAQLGELFDGGEINMSVDFYEVNQAMEAKTPRLKTFGLGIDSTYEILNLMEEYDWGNGFKYNPATNIKLSVCIKMEFNKLQLLPSRFTTYFEIKPTINPLFSFAGSVNNTYDDDIIKFIPAQLIEFLKQQEISIDIPINKIGIESLPAKIKIEDIHIPTIVEANLSKETELAFGINGSFKVGYILDIVGLSVNVTPIYENSISAKVPSTSDVYGELITKSEIVITPNVSVLDDAYKVSGDIVFGLQTETYGSSNLPANPVSFASKGIFTSKATLLIDLILLKVPVEIINEQQELWNIGAFDKKVVYSDLSWKVANTYTNNWLLLSRMYETNFKLNYHYPILGKKIPNELFISYDVYQDNNATKIISERDVVITPSDVTNNSFSFKLSIPYKSRYFSSQTTSYLSNIIIKDRNGYVYEGIFNTKKGINENSFAIKR